MTDSTPASTTAPGKPSLGRKIWRILRIFILLFLLGLIALYFGRNALVRAGVVRGGFYATEQTTALSAADLSLNGSLSLNALDIDNIKGKTYKAPKILVMKKCDVIVQPSSLLSNTVQVESILIDGLEFTLEQDGMNNNLNDLMAILQKKTAATSKTETKAPGKELKIGVVRLTGTKVHVRGIVSLDIDLPDLELKDPTNPDGRPMKIADLVGKIIVHLGKQMIENPAIPGDMKSAMKNVNAVVDNLRGELEKNLKQFPIKDLKLPDNIKVPDIKVPDIGKDAGKTLDNLFNKKESN